MANPAKPKRDDTTIADIHRTRQRISDAFGGDIRAISEDARKRQMASGRPTVSFAPPATPEQKAKREAKADGDSA